LYEGPLVLGFPIRWWRRQVFAAPSVGPLTASDPKIDSQRQEGNTIMPCPALPCTTFVHIRAPAVLRDAHSPHCIRGEDPTRWLWCWLATRRPGGLTAIILWNLCHQTKLLLGLQIPGAGRGFERLEHLAGHGAVNTRSARALGTLWSNQIRGLKILGLVLCKRINRVSP
jgi:hypothetical protein